MSGAISVRITGAGLEKLAGIANRMADLSPFMQDKAVPIMRASVASEFLDQSWLRPDGGKEPWRPLVPFGNRGGSSPGVKKGGQQKPLIDTGAYFDAWTGVGSGAVVEIGPRSAVIGVSHAAFPFASYIRGGTGARIRTSPLLIFPQARVAGGKAGGSYVRQWKLWWYLGLTFDVWLSERTLRAGLKLFPRPHATNNPALSRRLGLSLAAWLKRAA